MLGYMTKKTALGHGFTHHGSYYGIPIWIGNFDSECPVVSAKAVWLDPVMDLFSYVESVVRSVAYPDREPSFCFRVGKAIDPIKKGTP